MALNFAPATVRVLLVSIKTSNTSSPCLLELLSFTLGTNSIPGYKADITV